MLIYLSFFDYDAMNVEHEFALDAVNVCAHSFGVLDDGIAMLVGIDEVGDVGTGSFDNAAVGPSLCRYEFVSDLLS